MRVQFRPRMHVSPFGASFKGWVRPMRAYNLPGRVSCVTLGDWLCLSRFLITGLSPGFGCELDSELRLMHTFLDAVCSLPLHFTHRMIRVPVRWLTMVAKTVAPSRGCSTLCPTGYGGASRVGLGVSVKERPSDFTIQDPLSGDSAHTNPLETAYGTHRTQPVLCAFTHLA